MVFSESAGIIYLKGTVNRSFHFGREWIDCALT